MFHLVKLKLKNRQTGIIAKLFVWEWIWLLWVVFWILLASVSYSWNNCNYSHVIHLSIQAVFRLFPQDAAFNSNRYVSHSSLSDLSQQKMTSTTQQIIAPVHQLQEAGYKKKLVIGWKPFRYLSVAVMPALTTTAAHLSCGGAVWQPDSLVRSPLPPAGDGLTVLPGLLPPSCCCPRLASSWLNPSRQQVTKLSITSNLSWNSTDSLSRPHPGR